MKQSINLEFAVNMTSNTTPIDILAVNPYESHPSLSPLEASALWEYAKLAHNVRMVG
jgi:DASH complex subunit DAD3